MEFSEVRSQLAERVERNVSSLKKAPTPLRTHRELHGKNSPFAKEYMGPSQTDPYQINVGIRAYGPTKAHYSCICDEVGEANGDVEFTVPQQDHS
jgi:hypothetical protein